jgi:hypothetical protein
MGAVLHGRGPGRRNSGCAVADGLERKNKKAPE